MHIPSTQRVMVFTYGDSDKEYSLPIMRDLPLRYARRFSSVAMIKDEAQAGSLSLDIFEELMTEYCPEIVEELTLSEAQLIMEAWQNADEDVTLGE